MSPDAIDNRWILQAKVHVPDNVIYRWFENETILLNLTTGEYHGLNSTGGRMLQLLDDTDGAIKPAIELLAEETEVAYDDIAGDLADFCSALAARGLVEVDESSLG